jgi:hypothetical protein
MNDFWRSAIRQQFRAAIDMLANAIQACPDSVWSGEPPRAFWYIAFHTLFFLDMYLSPVGEAEFRPPVPFGLTELADRAVPPGAGAPGSRPRTNGQSHDVQFLGR